MPVIDGPSPAAIDGLYATGYWLFTSGRIAHALNVFRAMVHLSPFDERGFLALGACFEAQEQPDLALDVYGGARRVLRVAPRCEVAAARVLRARGRVLEARAALAEAARGAEVTGDAEIRALVEAEWVRG